MTVTPPRLTKGRNQTVPITDPEKNALERLNYDDGAWTHAEATAVFGERLQYALDHRLLGAFDTLMGTMYVILGHGRFTIINASGDATSVQSQITKAYLRLSIAQLGWRVILDDEPSRKLTQFDWSQKRKMLHVKTEFGECLVTGHMRGGGYSRQALEWLTKRFKSTALSRNFYVVVLTPSPNKGRMYAKKQASFLKLITVLPRSTISDQLSTRIKVMPPRDWGGREPDDRPYLAGTGWLKDPRYQNVPDLTKQTLTLSRTDRIDAAWRALECDAAMSSAQLERHFGLEIADLEGVRYVETIVRSSKDMSANEVKTVFLTASRQIANGDDTALAHRCGTAEIRYMLGVDSDPARWQAEVRGRLSYENPDAVYVPESGGEIAVEFDAGSYGPRVIDRKLRTFKERGFQETIWAVTTDVRQRNLTKKIGDQLKRDVMLVNWWE
ncbi:hypothetical protein GCM10022631_07220 [Deinococcus rubellus]|uniref:hypothetical protein n=1 Tax=Deinococcus rubellus TaxID=1889240 RepID=UPI0031EF56AC